MHLQVAFIQVNNLHDMFNTWQITLHLKCNNDADNIAVSWEMTLVIR